MSLDKIQEPLQRAGESLGAACRSLGIFVCAMADFAAAVLPVALRSAKASAALMKAPPRVRHLALHGKKYRTQKKNINRALREYQRRSQKSDRTRTTESRDQKAAEQLQRPASRAPAAP